MFQRTDNFTQRASGDLGVQCCGIELLVSKQHLNHTDVDLLLEQMSRKTVATGIITLLMNRNPIESTTDIIPTTVRPSTSSAVCDASTMKRLL